MKQLIKYIAVVVTMLIACVQSHAYDFEVGGIYYSIVSFTDFTCKVTSGENEYKGNIVIPAEVEYNSRKLKVVWIGFEAFKECTSLTSVSIPNSVTYIGESAFSGCVSLASVTIPNSVTEIGKYAFSECSSLTSVTIPNSVIEIGGGTFHKCYSLKSITIPDSVTRICDDAFWKCSSLTSVIIPNSVTEIGGYAFYKCSSLASVTIPNSVTKIEFSTFCDCTSLASVTIPNSVTVIGDYAFDGCSSLASVTIPNSVTEIGYHAFSECSSLTSIKLPESIQTIDCLAFSGCTTLKSVTAEAKSGDEEDTNKRAYIGFGTFGNCTSLESVTISGNVNQIWQYSNGNGYPIFGGCESLRQINFPYGEELQVGHTLGDFKSGSWDDWTHQIEKIYINRKFSEDIPIPNVTELVVGEHVKNLDITYTGKIAKITISATTPPSVIGFTNPEYMNAVVKVPFSALEAYKAHRIWGKFWNLQGFDPAGIDGVEADVAKKSVEGRYDLKGTPVDDDYKGVAIIRFSDGSTKKVMI